METTGMCMGQLASVMFYMLIGFCANILSFYFYRSVEKRPCSTTANTSSFIYVRI